jgi:outer membrane immunogenic protein
MHKFRTQLLATTAILALSGAAYAADMAVKAPPVAPVAPVTNWTGFYVGVQAGGGSFDPSCHSDPFTVAEGFDPCFQDFEGAQHSGHLSSSSFIGGGRVGYDYQWGKVVTGIVGQFDWANFNGTVTTTALFDPGSALSASEKIDWLASVRGRVGWAFDNVLFYGTAGVAWTEIKTGINWVPGVLDADFPAFSGQATSHKTGAVAGGGFEYRFTPNVSLVGELLWYGFGSTTVSAFCAACGTGATYTTQFNNQDILAGTLGVNWRF